MDPLDELLKGNSASEPCVAHGRPVAAIFTCMDARIDPQKVFGRGPGALYCVRTAGHVPGPEVAGSLEIGLGVGCPLVLVLGHTDCAAVKLARGKGREYYSVTRHIQWAARDLPETASIDEVTEANVRHTVKELRTRLKGRVEGAILDLSTGKVRALSC